MSAKFVRVLSLCAIFGWLVSLFLPGFMLRDGSVMWGWSILSMLPFAWLSGGWPVYANIFFLYVSFNALRAKPAPVAVSIMLLLMLTIVSVDEVMVNEAGHTSSVVSWGWGAILWILSLTTVAFVSISIKLSLCTSRALALVVVGIGCVVFGVVSAFRYQQWEQANAQDRAVFLPLGMAFTTVDLCKAPYVWPEASRIPVGERISIEVDKRLEESGRPSLSLPQLPRVSQQNGVAWVTFDRNPYPIFTVKVQVPVLNTRYVLKAGQTASGAYIRMLDTIEGTTLYEQPLEIRRNKNGFASYCPTSWEHSADGMGYQKAILRLFQPDSRYSKPLALKPEAIVKKCNPETDSRRPADNRLWGTWDGRKIILPDALHGHNSGLCSDSYAAIVAVYLQLKHADSPPEISAVTVWLFDRLTLRPVAGFSHEKKHDPGASNEDQLVHKVYEAPSELVEGLRIDSNDVINVRTQIEKIAVRRFTK